MWSTLSPCLSSSVPCSRSKLAACVHDGHIYMLGGRNGNIPVRDFWKYSLTEHVWTEMHSSGDVPSNLQDHTMVGWKGRLYVFGGEVGFASTGETPLWVYDIAENHWRKLTRHGNIQQPKGCRGHTAVVHQGAMYIYGGYRDLKGSTNELWSYDFDKEQWRLATFKGSSEIPTGRHNHSVVVHDSAMWVYGGMTDLQAKADFWKWDFVARRWSRVRSKGGPGELHGHTACKILTSMVIFGGERSGQLLNEIWKFYFATDTWEKLVFHGVQPSPRSRHLAIVVPTLLLLLPHLYDGQQQQQQTTPQHKQRQFQELVSSGSYAPSFSPGDLEPPPPPPPPQQQLQQQPRLPKSETISNCRDLESDSNGRKITSSFSHTNFKFLKERISTTTLFKAQNSSYVALSNSSESVHEDSESGVAGSVVVFGVSTSVKKPPTTSPSIYNLFETNKNSVSNRLYGRSLLSVPNFQKIQTIELCGLMEDMSDSSSVDAPVRNGAPEMVNNQTNSFKPKVINSNLAKRHSSYVSHATRTEGDAVLDNGAFCRAVLPGMVAQDSLESIPDIKDFVLSEMNNGGEYAMMDCETGSLKLIDLDGDCEIKSKSTFTSSSSSSPLDNNDELWSPTAGCAVQSAEEETLPPNDNGRELPTLPVVNENLALGSHKDYASCLNVLASPDAKTWPNLELKTFPRLADFDEDCHDEMEERLMDVVDSEQQSRGMSSVTGTPQEERCGTDERRNNNISEKQANARHFSMLLLGGREHGVVGCGRKPITVWKLDFWK